MAESDVELLPLEGATSAVWSHFGFPARNGKILESDRKKRQFVHCKLCPKRIKYSGNTTNMRSHLWDTHRREHSALLQEEEAKRKLMPQRGSKEVLESGQLSIAEGFTRGQPLDRSSPRWAQITKAVCRFVAKDMRPYSTVNDRGFRHLLQVLEPRYTPPDRKLLATKYIPALYEQEKTRIQQKIEGVKDFGLTTDIWTSRAKHAYTSLTIHYIDDTFQLQSHLLSTREFPESRNAENINDELQEIIGDWGLTESGIAGITTDNGSNILAAVDLLQWPHVSCSSHTLQLGVEKAMKLPQVAKALARRRRLVSHFNHSAKSSYLLKKKQDDLHHVKHSLIQDVVTRWNSAYYMVERVLEQQQPLCAALFELRKEDLMPSDSEFSVMECYKDVMEPLVDVTKAIGGEKWVTISIIRPLLHKLLNVHLKPATADSRLVCMIKESICSDLQDRYVGSALDLLTKAAFLDPRFKALPFLKSEKRQHIVSLIEEDVEELINSETTSTQSTEAEEAEPAVKRPVESMCYLNSLRMLCSQILMVMKTSLRKKRLTLKSPSILEKMQHQTIH